MIALNVPTEAPRPTPGRGRETGALLDALQTETRLLLNLLQILRSQRNGVAQDDLQAVDDSVYSAQRVLLTLAEARRRRRSLMQIVGGAEDGNLDDLERALGPLMDDEMREARNELTAAARLVAAELDINRRVLQSAIRTGETYVKALYGVSENQGVYTPAAEPAGGGQPGAGLLLNRQV